ncbi:Fur family ferric uptake transcriptional regulator [Pedobacter sp. CG_S7]|uniref:Fur family transcriptional regulator n=1 Tax=Pedobacter sp. CG_S7 TaxID=3143930 RepID=UPI003395E134
MDNELAELLGKYKLSKTEPRLKVLSILRSRESAISQPELENLIGGEIDRVTLYRTLTKFDEKGIIHKVLDLNGTANYALCSSSCSEDTHNDEHVHFNCTTCLNMYCLEALQIPHLVMPVNYVPHNVNFIVYGVCEKCTLKVNEYIKNKK